MESACGHVFIAGSTDYFPQNASFGTRDWCYNTIKINVLREAQDPIQVFQLTKQILAAGTYATGLGFDGFAACVMSILAPDLPELQGQGNEEIFALRKKISRYPLAEAFCKDSAKLALANRQ